MERRVQSASSRKASKAFNTLGANCRKTTEKFHHMHSQSHNNKHKKQQQVQKPYKHSISPIQVDMSAQNQDLHTFTQDFTKVATKSL